VAGTGRFWHSDYSFFHEPLSTTLTYPQILPEGTRETIFIDMARMWRELPDNLRSWVEHSNAFHEATWF
jgi:taurine dioxygenase